MTTIAITDPFSWMRPRAIDAVAPRPRHNVELLGEPRDVSVARGFTRHVLARAAAPDAVDNVALVVSELVTAAVLSSSGPISLEIDRHHERAIVYVTTARTPCCATPRGDISTPEWMRVVDRLTTDWWIDIHGDRTVTVALVPLQPTPE